MSIAAPLVTSAQLNFDWALSQGSKESDFAGSLQQDNQGHLYSFYMITDTADLDPGIGEDLLIIDDQQTGILTKWTTEGEYLWSGRFQCPFDISGGIMEIKDNQMLLYLHYTDSLVYTLGGISTTVTVNPGNHVCVLRLDLDGNVTFFKDIHDGSGFYFSYLKSNDAGFVIGGGSFTDSIALHTASGQLKAISQGQDDAYIALFTPDFNAIGLQILGGKGSDYVENLYVANDRIYFAIVYDDSLTIDHGQQSETFPSNGEENGLFGYVTISNNDIVAYSFGGDLGDELRSVAADNSGNIYVCGSFEGTVNFEHPDAPPVVFTAVNESDGFVSKYTPDGRLAWTRIFKDSEYGGLQVLYIHRDNQLYLTGTYTGHTDLDPGPDSIIVETPNWGDIYTVKFDTDGNMKWVYSFAGQDLEGIRDLVISPEGRLFLIGFNYDTFDADPSDQTYQVPYYGGSDIFLIGLTEENVITSSTEAPAVQVALYPNPSASEITLSAALPIENATFYASNGAMAYPHVVYAGNNATANISQLTPGMYIVRVKTEESYSAISFFKQ